MKEKDKQRRIRTLWYKLLAKAKGAVLVLDRFSSLTRRIYLFGTSKKLKYLVEQDVKPNWWIILPESRFRLIWNVIVLLLLLYTACIVPYTTAFYETTSGTIIEYFEVLTDAMYIMDFLLNFFMAYEDRDKKIEVRLRFITINYIRTWFLLDFLACIPFQYFEPDTENQVSADQNSTLQTGESKLYKLIRVLRLLKLIRLVKYNRSMTKILQGMKMNQGIKRMVSVTITMLFMVHLIGCLFFLLAKLEDFSPDTWVTRYGKIDDPPFR